MDINEANRRGYKHKNLIFWLGIIDAMAMPISPQEHVLDFGCGHGLFLQLLFEINSYSKGVGIDIDEKSIDLAKSYQVERGEKFPIEYFLANNFSDEKYKENFDVIFCQEVFWMNNDLSAIAKRFYKLLKPGGRCYCTMGSHTRNPLWSHRRTLMESQGIQTNTYDLDDVAVIFSDAGFSVGMRRMPIQGFIMYHPESTKIQSRSFSELVSSTCEHKMLFYFGKNEEVQKSERLQG